MTIIESNNTIHNYFLFFSESFVGRWVKKIYLLFLAYPLHQLYRRGIWNGKPLEDICAQLTNYEADFWAAHPIACTEIVERNFDSWLAYAEFIIYISVWFFLLKRVVCRCLCS